MIVYFIIKIIFNILLFLPLTSGNYCFSSVRDPLRHVCHDLQAATHVNVEDCCTIRNITNGRGGFAKILINDTSSTHNDTYVCTFCSSIRVADHWTEWSECSVTCGEGGVKKRYRKCPMDRAKPPAMECYGQVSMSEECDDLPPCESFSNESSTFLYNSPCDERIYLIIVTTLLIIIIRYHHFHWILRLCQLEEKTADEKTCDFQRNSEHQYEDVIYNDVELRGQRPESYISIQ